MLFAPHLRYFREVKSIRVVIMNLVSEGDLHCTTSLELRTHPILVRRWKGIVLHNRGPSPMGGYLYRECSFHPLGL